MNEPIYFDEQHRQFRDNLRRFVEQEVVPQAAQWEEQGMVPRAVLRKMGELGYLGVRYGEQYGGSKLDTVYSAILAEELGRSTYGGFAVTVMVHTDMASPHLANFGTPEQLARYLPAIIGGEKICAVAVTEPDAGSDVAGIRTRAVRDGDHWVINGSKMFITNGVHGDVYFVAAKTDPTAKGSRGISIFIVEKGTLGLRVGRTLKKSGWLCSDTAELVFEDCRIPAANLLGEEGKGFYSVMKNFQTERIALAAMAVGHCQRALQLTLDYVRQRQAFGGPLWNQQTIRQRLSMLDARTRAARQFMYHCAWRVTQGHDIVQDVSMLKALTGELVNEVVQTCQQFHGGMGYIRETAIERLWRDARVLGIGGGATEVMLEEVAKRY